MRGVVALGVNASWHQVVVLVVEMPSQGWRGRAASLVGDGLERGVHNEQKRRHWGYRAPVSSIDASCSQHGHLFRFQERRPCPQSPRLSLLGFGLTFTLKPRALGLCVQGYVAKQETLKNPRLQFRSGDVPLQE